MKFCFEIVRVFTPVPFSQFIHKFLYITYNVIAIFLR